MQVDLTMIRKCILTARTAIFHRVVGGPAFQLPRQRRRLRLLAARHGVERAGHGGGVVARHVAFRVGAEVTQAAVGVGQTRRRGQRRRCIAAHSC